jgi:hypothetical protein
MSFLSTIGKDFKAVFAFLGSQKGQTIVSAAEGVGEAIATAAGLGAPVQAAFTLLNKWGTEIVKTEALAAAAGQQEGSGPLKAAAVLSQIGPELAWAQSQGLGATSAANIALINDSLVTILKALGATAPPVAPPVSTP